MKTLKILDKVVASCSFHIRIPTVDTHPSNVNVPPVKPLMFKHRHHSRQSEGWIYEFMLVDSLQTPRVLYISLHLLLRQHAHWFHPICVCFRHHALRFSGPSSAVAWVSCCRLAATRREETSRRVFGVPTFDALRPPLRKRPAAQSLEGFGGRSSLLFGSRL